MNAEPRRRRWGIRLLAIGLLLLGAPSLLIWVYTLDEPPPDDADLLPARVEVPAEENAFEALQAAHQLIRWPDGRQREIEDMASGGPWDAALAGEFITGNREFYEEFDRALARGRLRAPRRDNNSPWFPCLLEFRQMSNLFSLMARSRLEAGDPGAALPWGLRIVQLGHLIENGSEVLVDYLVGMAIRALGLSRVRGVVELESSPEDLLDARRALERRAPSADSFSRMLKGEYQYFTSFLDRAAAGDLDAALGDIPAGVPSRFVIRENQTRRLMAQVVRDAAASARAPWSERHHPEGSGSEFDSLLNLLLGNPYGKLMVGLASHSYDAVLKFFTKSRFDHDATRLLIALRAYQLEKGALPGALEELAPRYIDAVPPDPFDGKPMRYSAERRVIYSVGDDLQDAGGAAGGDSSDLSEPTVRIPF